MCYSNRAYGIMGAFSIKKYGSEYFKFRFYCKLNELETVKSEFGKICPELPSHSQYLPK